MKSTRDYGRKVAWWLLALWMLQAVAPRGAQAQSQEIERYRKLDTAAGWVEFLGTTPAEPARKEAREALASTLSRGARIRIAPGGSEECSGGSLKISELSDQLRVVGDRWKYFCQKPEGYSYEVENPTAAPLLVLGSAHGERFRFVVKSHTTARGSVKVTTACQAPHRQSGTKQFARGRVTFLCNERFHLSQVVPLGEDAGDTAAMLVEKDAGKIQTFLQKYPQSLAREVAQERLVELANELVSRLLRQLKTRVELGPKPARQIDGQSYKLTLTNPGKEGLVVAVQIEQSTEQEVKLSPQGQATLEGVTSPGQAPKFQLLKVKRLEPLGATPGDTQMARYFIARGQDVIGPVDASQVASQVASDGADSLLVCREGGSEWASPASIPGLLPAPLSAHIEAGDPTAEPDDDRTAFMPRLSLPSGSASPPAPQPPAPPAPAPQPPEPSQAPETPPPPGQPGDNPTPRRARGATLRRLVSLGVVLSLLGGGSAFALSAYRTHRAGVACEAAEEEQRTAPCNEACDRGSEKHCVAAAKALLKTRPEESERRGRALMNHPEHRREALLVVAEALQQQKKHSEAERLLAPLLEAGDRSPQLKRLLAVSRLQLGQEALGAGKPESALEHLRSAHELHPHAENAAALGEALVQLERWDEAVKPLERAVESSEATTAQPYRELTRAYRELGKEDAAKKALRRGVAANRDDYALHKMLAATLVADKHGDEALTLLESYSERHASHEESHLDTLALISDKDTTRRKSFLERWRKQSPESEEACLQVAQEWPRQEQDRKIELLKQCTRTVPQPQRIYEEVAPLIEKQQGTKAAHAFLDKERQEHPERTSLVDLQAQLYVRQKKPKEAEKLIDQAIAEHPDDPTPTIAKVRYLESTRSVEAASVVLEAAKERFASHIAPFRFALGFHTRTRHYDLIEAELRALRALGVDDIELSRLREITTFGRTSVSCVTVGQGPAVAGYDRTIPASAVSSHSGFWSGGAVQRGYIVNRCGAVTVDADVTVSFQIQNVAHVFIFAQVSRSSKSQSFQFRKLRPGEARPFSAGVSLSALSLGYSPVGTLGGIGAYSEVSGVSVNLRVLSPRLP